MFKKHVFFLLLISLIGSNSSFAQSTTISPDGILFQAVARDANGNAAISRTVYAKVNILKSTATGAVEYAESFQVTSSAEGIFTIIIGKGTRTAGATGLAAIDWANFTHFLNLQVAIAPTVPDPNWVADNQYVDLGTSQFWSVPYTLFATRSKVADSALSIGSIIVPSEKGGTGFNNNGKTISIANNIITKGVGDLTITTTAASNIIFPTAGTLATLAGTETLTNKTLTSPLLVGRPLTITQDTATADSTIASTLYVSKKINALALATGASAGAKLNISDTAAMLSTYATLAGTQSLTNKTINGLTPTALTSGFSIAGGTSSRTTLTVSGTSNVSGINTGDQTIALTGDVSGTGSGTFSTTVNSVGGVSAANIATINTTVGNATSTNINSALVRRDVSGNFSANIISATLSGTASNVSGVVAGANGGTGVANTGKTITLGGNINTANSFTTIGNAITLTSAGVTNVTLPITGTLATLSGTETLTNKTISATNNTIAGLTNANLSGTAGITDANLATIATAGKVANSATTATDLNTPNAIVKRDATGNFNAGTITGNLTGNVTGNATTATTLAASKNIYGNAFDGSANLTQVIAPTFGGTGVDNTGKTITLGGNISTGGNLTTGANNVTLNTTGATTVTLPLAGTLATIAGAETLSNKIIVAPSLTGVPTTPTASAGTSTTQVASTAFVTTAVATATPDASTTVKGKVQLSGDLSGTAVAPTVATVGGSTATDINAATLLANAATEVNTAGAIVKRDGTGNFSAGNITANLTGNVTGNATTATTLATSKNIYGNSFDGSANLTQVIAPTFGGTGVDNTGKTITLGGNILTGGNLTTGANNVTLNTTGATTVTLPLAGTLATIAGAETLSNKTITSPSLTGVPTAPTAAAGTNTTQVASTAFVTTAVSTATPDASTIVKGKVQLTNDLGGTATAPVVNSVGGVSSNTISTLPTLIAANTASITAETSRATAAEITLQSNIDAEATRATNAETTLQTNINSTNASLTAETTRATSAETVLSTRITSATTSLTAEVTRATAAETTLQTNITANTNSITANIADIALRATIASPSFTGTPTAPTATLGNNTNQIATTAFVAATTAAATPDATTLLKGKVQLTNDLGGTATAPVVNSVGGVSSATISTLPTLIAVNTASLTAETTRAITAETTLQTNINATNASLTAETTRATTAEAANTASITSETSRAITAENTLSTRITSATSSLTAEVTRATAAETTLQTNINATNASLTSETTRATTAEAANTASITAETSRATAAETTLQSNINATNASLTAETSRATAAENTLQTNINSTNASLTSEITRATTEEGNLNTRINSTNASLTAETSRATTAENTLSTRITSATTSLTAEVTRATAAETTLQSNINATNASLTSETSRATAAETTLQSNINSTNASLTTETTRASTAETSLQSNINSTNASLTAEVTRATVAENNLSTRVTSNTASITTNIADIALRATIASPSFTGTPTAPTPTTGDNSTQIATTAFVAATTAAATPDASSILKGKLQLAGDLGGSAASPSVVTVGGSTASNINAATVLTNNATANNNASQIVKRDASGNFTAGVITADLLGTATNVTGVVLGVNGGTGVANTGRTITLGGDINTGAAFTTTGTTSGNASDITLKTTGATELILPLTGTLATKAGVEALTNKTINGLTPTSAATGFTISGGTASKTLTVSDNATVSGNNTGDQTITLTGDLTGTGTGSFATTLANSGVTAGSYGTATQVPTITVDAKGRVTNVSNTTITGVSPAGSAMSSGKIVVGDASNLASIVDMSGDVTISNTGATTIGANKITTTKINNSAVTYAKMQNVSASDKVLGRVSSGAGVVEEIATTGTGSVVRSASPTFTGAPQVPTAVVSSNDQTIANTEYVTRAIGNISASSVSGILPASNGGTGVDNTGKTITLAGSLITSGTNTLTFTTTGPTNVTVPTSGTLATTADLASVAGGNFNGSQITGIVQGANGGTGIDNTGKTITLGGNIATGAAFTTTGVTGSGSAITLKTTAATDITLPTTGTIATLAGTETLTNKTIVASSNNISGLTNANLSGTAGITDANLATITTAGKVANTATTGTSSNTANAIVARDVNGNFTANTITAALNGNAATATKLATARSIYGNSFDGTADLGQVIASTYGGTGNAYTKFTGATSTEKVYTLPDANTTILTTNALVTVAQGGTGTSTVAANTFFAGPSSGSNAAPGFRTLTASDLPSGSGSYIANSTTQQASSNFNISADGVVGGTLTAGTIVKQGGTSSQFLKADGTVDSRSFATLTGNEALTNKTVNGLTPTALGTGFSIAGGSTTSKTLTVGNNANVAGTNTGDVSISGENYLALTNQTLTANAVDLSGTNATGILAAARFPAMTGDVTNTAGTVATLISNNAITSTKIADNAVTSTKIADNAIVSSKIATSAVTLDKIASISTQKLLGNKSNSAAGAPGEISIGAGLSLNASTGELSASGTGGTVTSVNALTLNATGNTLTSTVSTASSTPVISLTIPLASVTGTTAGLLSKADYDVFNAKQTALTLGTGIQTFLATPTSANLATAVTNEIGTGRLVFATGPTLTSAIINGLKIKSDPNHNIGFTDETGLDVLSQSPTPSGYHNIAMGANAMGSAYLSDLTGWHNIAIGNDAGGRNASGMGNVYVGKSTGMLNYSGSYNTFLGYEADADVDNPNPLYTNATAIGNGAKVTGSNKIQLGDANITNVKTSGSITAGGVTYPNTHNGITNQVLSINASGTASFITLGAAGASLTNGKILVGNASNVGTEITVSGDVSMTNAGVVNINAGVITTTDMANSAVTYGKMQNVSATNTLLGRTSAGAGVVEEIPMAGSGNVNRALTSFVEAGSLTLSDANSGQIIYTQNAGRPAFPENLSDGFNCTIVNYSNSPAPSNTLTTAKFFTNNTGNVGTNSFTIPAGGSVNVSVITAGGVKRYYINAGDVTVSAGTGLTNTAGALNINTSQNISTLSNLTTNGIVTTSGGTGALSVISSLPVTQGGTGQTTYTDGQLLIGNATGNTLSKSTLTAGSGVNITNGNGSITISATGTGGTVTNVNALTVNASGSTLTSTVSNATTTPTISLTIPLASVTGTTAGLLSNADYATFNAKQTALTLGTGIQTFLATPTSANLISAVTDETGTGSLVFGTSPSLTTPTLGVASATSVNGLRIKSAGNYNIGIAAKDGYDVLSQSAAPTGTNNIAIGNNALGFYYLADVSGSHNIALGSDAGGRNGTGSGNIFLGSSTGMNNFSASNNTFIGYLADVNANNPSYTNATAIGYNAKVTGSNKIQLGDGSINNVSTSGTLTAGGVTYPNAHNGISNQVLSINASGTASFTTLGAAGATLTNGKFLLGNASNVGTEVTMSGDVSMTNTGAATLTNTTVSAGSYGSSTAIPTFTVDAKGRLTAASTIGIVAGVNSLNYTSTTSYASGGTISGTSLTLAAADANNPGLISTGTQTIAGSKTFTGTIVSTSTNASSVAGKFVTGTNTPTSASAVLEANSTTQGFLPPRLTLSQRDAIASPATGLIVMCSDCGVANGAQGELQMYNGQAWRNIAGTVASGTTSGTTAPAIGSSLQGGVVAYVLAVGDPGYEAGKIKGFIASTNDLGSYLGRLDGGTRVAGITNTDLTLGTGLSNFNKLVTAYGTTNTSGVKLAYDYTITENGVTYDDWYIPSRDELLKLYANKTAIGNFALDGSFYWTSNLCNSSSIAANYIRFTDGFVQCNGTEANGRVRAIRNFTIDPQTGITATNFNGNATTASALATGRTISATGDITYTSGTFDGSANVTGTATLANTAVTAGSYGSSTAIPTFTVDSKGRLTAASTVGIIAGVNSLSYTSTTSYASGGTISGTSLTLAAADGTNPGLLSVGAQTIAGTKSFTSAINAPIYSSTPLALTPSAGTITWTPVSGLNAGVTLAANSTLTFGATPPAGTTGTLIVTQPATGGPYTLTLPNVSGKSNKVLGSTSTTNITLSSTASAKDIVSFYYDGNDFYWNVGLGYGLAQSVAASSLIGGTAGALVYQSAANTTAFLTPGSNGQVLTLTSGLPSWTNAVASVTGSGTASYVPRFNASTSVLGNSSIYDDGASTYINATSGAGGNELAVFSSSRVLPLTTGTAQTGGAIRVGNSGNEVIDFGTSTGAGWLQVTDKTTLATNNALLINPNGGNVGIGLTATPSSRLQVNGAINAPAYSSTPVGLTAGATITWTPLSGLNASVTLNANSTLAFGATPPTGSTGTLVVTQPASGGPYTLALPSGLTNKVLGSSSGLNLSTTANATDVVTFYYDGTTCYWNVGLGYGITQSIAATGLAGGVAGAIPYQTGAGATGFTAAGTAGQLLTSGGTGSPAWITALPIANGGTGSTTQNFVDITTTQTIAGNKTFSGATTLNGALTINGTNVLTAGGTTFPTATGTAGQVLTLSAAGAASWAASSSISGGTTNALPKYSSATAITPSAISDDGTTVTLGSTRTLTGANASVNAQTGTTYTLVQGDNGKVITLTNAGAITLTLPTGLTAGFNCMIVQYGAGTVTLVGSGGANILNRSNYNKTGGQYAVVTIVSPVGGTFITGGDMQ